MGTPVFGRVDENNNIILTGNLADGKYTLKYEDADGNLTEIGTLNQVQVSYTNLADQTSADWLTDKRINSSGNLVDAEGVDITNYIPVTDTSVLHVKGIDIISSMPDTSNYGRMYFYEADETYITYGQPSAHNTVLGYITTADYDDSVYILDWPSIKAYFEGIRNRVITHIRLGGIPTAEEIIITDNENIQ